MKKLFKFLSVFCCIFLIISSFSLTAFASVIPEAFMFLNGLTQAWISEKRDEIESMSGEEFYYWYNSNGPDSTLWQILGGSYDLIKVPHLIPNDIDNMNNSHYAMMEMSKSQLEKLKDDVNEHLGNYYGGLRYNTFSDFNLSTYDEIKAQSGTYLGLSGSGSFVHYGVNYDGAYYQLNTKPSPGEIALYTGSNQAPWCMFVPSGSCLYQNGVLIANSDQWVLPLDYDTVIVLKSQGDLSLKFRWTSGNTISNVGFGFQNTAGNTQCALYRNGELQCTLATLSKFCSNYDFVSRLSKMINVLLSAGYERPGYEPVTLPDDIPYENDKIIVCVPDDGGDPVYLSPSVYNNYIDNGNLVYDNDYNYDYSQDFIDNIKDSYNNYITNNNTTVESTYDDTNLLNNLGNWFDSVISKLEEISSKITFNTGTNIAGIIIDLFDSDGGGDLGNIKFNELLKTKFPFYDKIISNLLALQNMNTPLVISCKNPIYSLVNVDSNSNYPDFSVDFSWFDEVSIHGVSGREFVRNGIGVVFKFACLYYLYNKITNII